MKKAKFSLIGILLLLLVMLAPAVAVLPGPPVNVALAQEVTEEMEVSFAFSETSGGAWQSFTAGSGGTPVTLQQYTRPQLNSASTVPGCGFREYSVGNGTVSGDLTGSITWKWNMWRFNITYPYTPVYYSGNSMFGFMFGRAEVDCGGGNTFNMPFIVDLGGNVDMVNAAGKGVTASYDEAGAFAGHKIFGNIDMTKTGTSYSGTFHIRNYPPDEIFYLGVVHVDGEVVAEDGDHVAESCQLVYFNSSYGDYHTESSDFDNAGLEELDWGEEEASGAAAKYVTSGPIGTGGYVDGSRNSFMDSGKVSIHGEFDGVLCQKLRINDTYAMTGDDNTTHGIINQLVMLDMPYQTVNAGEWSKSEGYGITPYGLWEPCTESYEEIETFGLTTVGVQAASGSGPYTQESDTESYACCPHPKVFAVDPAQGCRGDTLDVVISGKYFLRVKSEYGGIIDFGDNITVNNWVVDNETHITANITISYPAEYGTRDVNVTSCFGYEGPSPVYRSGVLDNGFSVLGLFSFTGRWVTSSSGEQKTSEHYTVIDVIGQGGAGRSESGNFTLEAGFLTPVQLPINTTIEGTIWQANTSLLPGANVVLKLGGDKVANTTSNATGYYNFTVNTTGDYTVNITKDGLTYQEKVIGVTTMMESYTCNFKGMDAPFPTAPDGLYVIKCCNLWLYGHLYPAGFALDATRVSDVVYAWVHS